MYNQALQNSGIPILKQFANVRQSNFSSQWQFWEDLYKNNCIDSYENYLINPYYIGAGNPDSDIIFIGKELAHNPSNNPILFFLESISNWYLWNEFIKNNNFNSVSLSNNSPPNIDSLIQNFTTQYQYCPLNPLYYEPLYKELERKKGNFTWKVENKIIKYSINTKPEDQLPKDGFFSKCFTTEFYCVPSERTNTTYNYKNTVRQHFIFGNFYMLSFINSFRNIIFGCSDYIQKIENYRSIIEYYFGVKWQKNKADEICNVCECKGRNKILDIFTRSNEKVVIICHQLSCSWSDCLLEEIGKLLIK